MQLGESEYKDDETRFPGLNKIGVFASVLFVISCCQNIDSYGQKSKNLFRDTTDNALDVSNFLLRKEGFLPVPTLITEPALGLGGAMSVLYFHSSFAEKQGPPNVSGLIGGGTNNGTWAVGGFHAGFWNDDKIRYLGALFKANVNIRFYGSGLVLNEGVDLNMDAWFLLQQIQFRIASSDFFIGTNYLYTNTKNTFGLPIDIPEFNGIELNGLLSELSLILSYDSRNNIITPEKGLFAQISGSYAGEWMGNESLYGRVSGGLVGFMPVDKRLHLAVRFDSRHSLGDVPFWARPIVDLRGVPLMKYQNKHTDVMETELTYNLYRRWHIKGFTGIGVAYKSMDEFNIGKSVRNIGTGFRYELARFFGLHMGMDFAWSNDDFGFYIVAGHAWIR